MVGLESPLQGGDHLSRRRDNRKQPAIQISRERAYQTEKAAGVQSLSQQSQRPVVQSTQMLAFDLLLHKNTI